METALHRHHAVQLCVALEGELNLRASERAAWLPCKSAIIPADVPHQFDAEGGQVALFYVDPEFRRIESGKPCASTDDAFAPIDPQNLALLLESVVPSHDAISPETVEHIRTRFLDSIAANREPAPLDSRIEDALAIMRELDDVKISLDEMASRVHLSTSRFGHLFRACTGLPFRRYLLWLRLQRSMQTLSDGSNLTDAAHRSGFADSAHLSRTFRETFGMAPVELVKYSQFIQAD